MTKQDDYVEKLSAAMVAWEIEIERLQDQSESAPPERRLALAATIASLQFQRDEGALKLQRIPPGGENGWEEISGGPEEAWGGISQDLQAAIVRTK